MRFFRKALDWLRKFGALVKCDGEQPVHQNSQLVSPFKFVCEHGTVKGGFQVVVFGIEFELEESPLCPKCAEEYLNKFSTLCASCGLPIFPGTPVAQAWIDAPHPYIHLSFSCGYCGGLYCGQWGEGCLITLHELNPKKYPFGTSSVAGYIFNTNGAVGMITENV
jgi:hypothetical protein